MKESAHDITVISLHIHPLPFDHDIFKSRVLNIQSKPYPGGVTPRARTKVWLTERKYTSLRDFHFLSNQEGTTDSVLDTDTHRTFLLRKKPSNSLPKASAKFRAKAKVIFLAGPTSNQTLFSLRFLFL